MEISVSVVIHVAVADEGVASGRTESVIEHGPSRREFPAEHQGPFVGAVEVAVFQLKTLGKPEVLCQCYGRVDIYRSGKDVGVIHHDRHAAGIHQFGHRHA